MYKDTVEGLLRDRPTPGIELSWQQELGRKRSTHTTGIALTAVSLLCILVVVWLFFLASETKQDIDDLYEVYNALPADTAPAPANVLNDIENLEERRSNFILAGRGLVVLAVIGVVVGSYCLRLSQKALAEQESERVWAMEFSRRMAELDLSQRLGIIGHLTLVDIEQLKAAGAFNAAELEYIRDERHIQLTHEENERVRQAEARQTEAIHRHESNQTQRQYDFEAEQGSFQRWFQSSEADKDRKHQSTESARNRTQESAESERTRRHEFKLAKTKMNKEMQILESRLKVQHPSEVDKTQEKLDAFRLEQMTWEAIEIMPEDTQQQRDEKFRRMEAFTRRLDAK